MLFEHRNGSGFCLESTTASREVTFRRVRRRAPRGPLRDVHGGEVVKKGQSKKTERWGRGWKSKLCQIARDCPHNKKSVLFHTKATEIGGKEQIILKFGIRIF